MQQVTIGNIIKAYQCITITMISAIEKPFWIMALTIYKPCKMTWYSNCPMSYLYVTYMSLLVPFVGGGRAQDDKHQMELRGTLQRLKMAPIESMVAWHSYLHENHNNHT